MALGAGKTTKIGAFLGIINKLDVFKLRLANTDSKTCACKAKGVCEVKCPAQTIKNKDIAVVNKEFVFHVCNAKESALVIERNNYRYQ